MLNIPSKQKTNYCILYHYRKKGSTTPSDHYVFLGKHISYLWILFWPIYRMTWKAASSKWGLEKKRALQQVQAVGQAALLLGPQDPQVLWCLRCRGRKHTVQSYENHRVGSWSSGARPCLLRQSLMHLLKNGYGRVIGHERDAMLDHTCRAPHC